MSELAPQDFPKFFRALHQCDPFPWQSALAEKVCADGWPEVIDLPTGCGKTACLDIALFALAATGNQPRRIFFVVDRRVIVNEAFERTKKVAEMLLTANNGILAAVANSLRIIGGGAVRPLNVYQLRGGIYQDQSWVRGPLQPMVVASTVDQVGSRLLFRGYGVSDSSAPIHASLIANDSLIFLDEAHCSRAFSQTLRAVRNYRDDQWAKKPLKRPFAFVEMTATPSRPTDQPFRLTNADYSNQFLSRRLFAEKTTTLKKLNGRANDIQSLATHLASQAIEMAKNSGAKRIAVMVNRVNTARQVFDVLSKHSIPTENLHLLIGRMRPVDRDELVTRLEPLKAGKKRDSEAQPTFVVSTQCLEVGADLDFDLLVTECASIDALLQRFGRLDRLGDYGGAATACILTLSGIADSKDPDPIYANCLSETWRWLNQLADEKAQVNMGIESFDQSRPTVAQALKALSEADAARLRRIGRPSPALLPAHLDALVQTSPKPEPDPEVAIFLHGRETGPAEIQVVWRRDIDAVAVADWKEIVALCPPVSAEAMPVRLDQFRRWLTGEKQQPIADSDLEGAGQEDDLDSNQDESGLKEALIWCGDDSKVVRNVRDIKPNSTVILALRQRGWEQFGHLPEPASDVAEAAIGAARDRAVFRIHKDLWPGPVPPQLAELIQNEEFNWAVWHDIVAQNLQFLTSKKVAFTNQKSFTLPIPYPAHEGSEPVGWVLYLRNRIGASQEGLDEDDGDDQKSRIGTPVTLLDHTHDVAVAAAAFATKLAPEYIDTIAKAADLHDAGKSDPRFQAMLHGGDHLAAALFPAPLAKGATLSNGLYQTARLRSKLPDHFRHELVSLHFAQSSCRERDDLDLLLHLIASHHGYCRPFAPVVFDHDPQAIHWNGIEISHEEQISSQAHHLSSGVARRFWRATREFGWWGSAYLETCLRLADWTASEAKPVGNDVNNDQFL